MANSDSDPNNHNEKPLKRTYSTNSLLSVNVANFINDRNIIN